MEPYGSFVARTGRLPRLQFLVLVKTPVLFLPTPPLVDEGAEPSFKTERVIVDAAALSPRLASAAVLPVAKRAGANAFPMMITLGRAPNNDLVIPDKRISSFHAYFRQAPEGWRVADVSSNGTAIDGAPVPREQELPLRSGARLTLAKTLELVFLLPDELYERVQRDRAER